MGVLTFVKTRSGFKVDNSRTTSAATLTLRQSIWPLCLVTILFFLWVRPEHDVEIDNAECVYRALPTVCWILSTSTFKTPYTSIEHVQRVSRERTLGARSITTKLTSYDLGITH